MFVKQCNFYYLHKLPWHSWQQPDADSLHLIFERQVSSGNDYHFIAPTCSNGKEHLCTITTNKWCIEQWGNENVFCEKKKAWLSETLQTTVCQCAWALKKIKHATHPTARSTLTSSDTANGKTNKQTNPRKHMDRFSQTYEYLIQISD